MARVVKDWDAFQVAAPPLGGAESVKGLKKGRRVSAGELLARHPDPRLGDVHAPVSGWIGEITEREIVIRRDDAAVGEPPRPRALAGLGPADLDRVLKELGLDRPEVPFGDALIVTTLDPEPGLTWAPALFGEQRETILAGLEAALRLWPGRRLVWVAADPDQAPPEAGRVVAGSGPYPAALPAVLKKRITGRSDPKAAGVLDGRALYALGRAWRTGLPLTKTILTLGEAVYLAPVGARVIDLLTFANLVPGPGDAVIRGGLARGTTLSRLERGLDRNAAGLHLLRGARDVAFQPCRKCRECDRACPAGLTVSRAAERDPSEWLTAPDCFRPYLDGCLLCGACALACPARRPLMSLIRLMVP